MRIQIILHGINYIFFAEVSSESESVCSIVWFLSIVKLGPGPPVWVKLGALVVDQHHPLRIPWISKQQPCDFRPFLLRALNFFEFWKSLFLVSFTAVIQGVGGGEGRNMSHNCIISHNIAYFPNNLGFPPLFAPLQKQPQRTNFFPGKNNYGKSYKIFLFPLLICLENGIYWKVYTILFKCRRKINHLIIISLFVS